MRFRFVAKLALFTLPFAIPFLMLTGALAYIGESMPPFLVLRMQDNPNPVLYRVGYGNRDQRYKRMAVDYFQPDVLVVGSSRVLQFRSQFLNRDPDRFYNSAAPAWRLPEITAHLDAIHHRPRIILLGIDDPWFNAAYLGDPIVQPPTSDFARPFIVNRTFIQEWIAGEEFDFPRLLRREEPGGSGGVALGMRAIKDGHGFRNDGSEQYGDFLVAQHLWQPNLRGLHMRFYENGEEMYVAGSDVDSEAIAAFRDILEYAKTNSILLIGFSPPYMPSLWQELATSDRHTYIQALTPELRSLFAEYDFPYFDFHDVSSLGATDEDFFDGWHHSERVAGQIYSEIAQQIPELQAYTDIDQLNAILDSATDTFRVFPFVGATNP